VTESVSSAHTIMTIRAVLKNMRDGEIGVYPVPAPELRSGGILVRTAFSAISSGTERAAVESAEKSILGRALARPEMLKQLLDFTRTNGVKAAYSKVQTRLNSLSPLGYSSSGTVVGVGDGVTEFQCGDRIACGGGGYANHCEVNWVPRNLAVRVPDSVPLEAASLTTVGAIAMQGLRQAEVNFGETVVVIGAGLVGVLTMQLARAAGCRVIAIDREQSRVRQAIGMGAQLALLASDPRVPQAVQEFSRYGADAAIVTAATPSAEPLELAAKVLRDRGRVVVVGDVGMGVSRSNMYHKELTLAMSRSYGPGRYDPGYEESGNDYPVGYVRWTERRNMEAFLDFLASGSVDVSRLLENKYSVDDAAKAYQELRAGKGYTAILEYPLAEQSVKEAPAQVVASRSGVKRQLQVGCIGAGGFATSQIFPNLKADSRVSLEAVATASGISAESARRTTGFLRAQTPSELLADSRLSAIFITSRHSSHAQYVVAALQNGKAIFVEKPLAVNHDQLELIRQTYLQAATTMSPPFVMVGFNRRFAPFTEKIGEFFSGRREPMMLQVRINAGFIPRDHWVQQPDEGGRIIGELCHFVDWARHVVGFPIRTVSAAALPDGSRYSRDNVSATLTFADGSLANLTYIANGDPAVPKEQFEIFCEGSVARLDDFEMLQLVRDRKTKRFKSAQDKGHRRELELTLQAMASGTEAPIPFDQIVEVTECTFSIAVATATGEPVAEKDPRVPLIAVSS
jgi:predicted dehydrogenase/threonine dehydrogenase-like Zn-dependent dehydrogenase